MRLAAIVLVTIALVPSVGSADDETDPDPEATRAGEANLESLAKRREFTFGAALGPSVTIGKTTGTGTGATLSLRLGQVATPNTVISFQLNVGGILRRVATGMDPMGKPTTDLRTSTISSFLAGAQYWFGPSIWIRMNGGLAVTTCEKCTTAGADTRRAGLAGGAGLGVDVLRVRGLVLGVEAYNISQITKDGLQTTLVSSISLMFD